MPGPNKKYVPKVEINAAPRMISANEQFDDSLAEPTEDFRDDFNPAYGDDNNYDSHNSYENNRIQTPIEQERDSILSVSFFFEKLQTDLFTS